MNADSFSFAQNQNHSENQMQELQAAHTAALNSGAFQVENFEQLDEVPISVPTVSPESTESLSQTLTPKNQTSRQKLIKKLELASKCVKKGLSRAIRINFSGYCTLNLLILVLFKAKVINIFFFLGLWFLVSLWFICYKSRHFLRASNLFSDLFGGRSFNNDLEQQPSNALIPNILATDNNSNVNANSNVNERRPPPQLPSNNDVLRRREVDNLVAFHPLRFHMIVGRLHNILNQLRENQMIINAAVMGNNREGGFNFRDFHDLLINEGLIRNPPQNNGFTEQEIDNLPQYNYEKTETIGEGKKPEDEEQCSICLMEFQNGESIRTLPCIHNFHKDCIDQWLKRQKYCPLCKGEIMFN